MRITTPSLAPKVECDDFPTSEVREDGYAGAGEPNIARILFPDEIACVKILEVLFPFSRQEQELILSVVLANKEYPRVVQYGGREVNPRTVLMPEPLASYYREPVRPNWREKKAKRAK